MHRKISMKNARAIIRREARNDFDWTWGMIQRGESILLHSGAKLAKKGRFYHIFGYAYDGRDVLCYL